MVTKLKEKYQRYFPILKYYRLGATVAITNETAKKSENTVFRSKQKTSKVPANIITGFKVTKKVRFMFSRPKYIRKGRCHVFSGYKTRNTVPFIFLDCKLKKDSYG